MNNDDKQIYEILNKLYQREGHHGFTTDIYDDPPRMNNAIKRLDRIMIDKGLVDEDVEVRMLTDFGLDVCNMGGWLEYLKLEESQQKIEEERQRRADEKLKYDMHISKYLYKTRWWPLIILLASLGVAIWALFKK